MTAFGSSYNALWTANSDIDVSVVFFDRQETAPNKHLQQLILPLEKLSSVGITHVDSAKVPIIKFRDEMSGLDIDLNVNNVLGIQNSELLYTYTLVD